jgi:hypothetical protein
MSENPRVRASVLHGYLRWLREHSYFDRVANAVAPDTRAMMIDPPFRTSWVDWRHFERVIDAFGAIASASEARRLGRQSTEESVLPGLRPILEAAMRRLASPATIYKRLGLMLQTVFPELQAEYIEHGESRGEIVLTFPYAPCDTTLEVWVGSLESAMDLAGAKGSVDLADRGANRRVARFFMQWS